VLVLGWWPRLEDASEGGRVRKSAWFLRIYNFRYIDSLCEAAQHVA